MMLSIGNTIRKLQGSPKYARNLYLHNEQGVVSAYPYNITASVRLPA